MQSRTRHGKGRQIPRFGSLAKSYALLERIVFRHSLQEARVAHLNLITGAQPASFLLTGDGDGRFLDALSARCPEARITTIDCSQRMLDQARARIGTSASRVPVRFVRGDLLNPPPPGVARYGAVVSHFILDCFSTAEVAEVCDTIKARLADGGIWVVTDFQGSSPGTPLWRNTIRAGLLWVMYRFFQITTGLRTSGLPDYKTAIEEAGFKPIAQASFQNGFVLSTAYRIPGPHHGGEV